MKELLFAMYNTANGPIVESKIERAFLLRVLSGYCEDLRIEIAAERAAALIDDRQLVKVTRNEHGVIIGKSG